jgi:hypothetical protein
MQERKIMSHSARLITPDGQSIDLPPDVYRRIRRLLAPTRRPSRARIDAAIRDTYGKYAVGSSLTQALLDERAADRRREDSKAARLHAS